MLPQFRTAGVSESFEMTFETAGLAGLPADLLINGTTVAPSLFYQAKDATTATWTGTGGTLTGAGSGGTADLDSPTPHADDRAVHPEGTRYWEATGNDAGDIGTEDFVFEMVAQVATTTKVLFDKLASGTNGYEMVTQGTTAWRFYIGDGTLANVTYTGVLPGQWCHVIVFGDRSGSMEIYVNGVAGGSPTSISAKGSITAAIPFHLGDYQGGGFIYNKRIAHVAMWKQDAWLDTHLQAAVALERYARCAGVWSEQCTISNARATAAYVDRVSSNDSVRRLHYVGANWHRVARRTDSASKTHNGYLSELAATNLCLQSEDFATTWTKLDAGDTINANNSAAPNGETTADQLAGDATDGEHGFSQAITLTAAAHTFSCWIKPGTSTWAYMDVSSIANVSAYFDLSGAGATGTVGSAATANIEQYGSWYRCELRYTGTVASHTHRLLLADGDADKSVVSGDAEFWGAQVEAFRHATSYIPTTTGTVTRNADQLQYVSTTLDLSRGTIACDVLLPDFDLGVDGRLVSINDGADQDDELLLRLLAAGDIVNFRVRQTATTEASVSGTTDVADNTWREVRATWATNDVQLYLDGTGEGTPDTSATMPSANLDVIDIGTTSLSAGTELDGLIRPRIFKKPTLRKPSVF